LQTRSHFRSWAAVLVLLALSAIFLRAGAEAEDELKCATLLAFLQNTHWLEQAAPASPSTASPLTIGVVGRAAFYRWLRAATGDKSVNGRRLRVVELAHPADPACCQVIYFATDKPTEIKPILQSFSSAHVLTMGENDGFLEEGGAVNLFLVDGHMAFEVSLEALGHAGLEISSKLLRFGQIRDLAKRRIAQ
jgi:hypothetical protein